MNLGFADALRRRPEPAWPLAEALRSLALASPVFATLLSTSLSIASFIHEVYFFFFFFFAAFAFFAFFAMLPSKQ